MAIATLSTVNDGLQPNKKERGHYVVDVNLEGSGPWIPYAEGVWVQLCRFNVTTGGFTVVLKGLPGGTVHRTRRGMKLCAEA
jgi:2,4'-dihydroxyacetophenone dioxygenase